MEAAAWIKKKSAGSLHPAQVETTLIRLNSAWSPDATPLRETIESFPLGEESLFRLFALSTVCAGRIVQNPQLLIWLSEVCSQARDRIDMTNELYAAADNNVAANNFRALR